MTRKREERNFEELLPETPATNPFYTLECRSGGANIVLYYIEIITDGANPIHCGFKLGQFDTRVPQIRRNTRMEQNQEDISQPGATYILRNRYVLVNHLTTEPTSEISSTFLLQDSQRCPGSIRLSESGPRLFGRVVFLSLELLMSVRGSPSSLDPSILEPCLLE